MTIGCAVLMCHAPIVIPAIAGARAKECETTTRAMHEAASALVAHEPELVVLISPHTPRKAASWGVVHDEQITGSFARFGHPEVALAFSGSSRGAAAIASAAARHRLRVHAVSGHDLDHGACVPLFFVREAGYKGPVVVVALPWPGTGDELAFGAVLREAADALGERWAVLASGDMSHRLTRDAPAGFDARAHVFDETFVSFIREGKLHEAVSIDPTLVERAGEDVVQSTAVALGAIAGTGRGTRVLAYEGPFGVGYCEAVLHADRAAERSDDTSSSTSDRGETSTERADITRAPTTKPPAELARIALDAIRAALTGEAYAAPMLASPWDAPHAVFVTLRSPDGELRGCVGRTEPVHEHLAEEVADCAVAAATRDYRMPSVELHELPSLRVEVSVLGHPEPVSDMGELDPQRYGVVVTHGVRRGVLLPHIDGVDSAADQLRIALHKGGIRASEPYRIERFRVRKIALDPS